MICEACALETDRLLVKEWHSLSRDDGELARTVADILTDRVTGSLPSSWQGSYTLERAGTWVNERDREGTTLLIVERSTGQAVGLMILHETDAEAVPNGIEVRIGYLLAEPAWGKGYASELIREFVGWCRAHKMICSLDGGVERGNPASARVMEKNGFRPVQEGSELGHQEQLFRLILRS